MVLQYWEAAKEAITAYTGLSPATFFTFLVLGFTLYYVVSTLFGSSGDSHNYRRSVEVAESVQPLPPPVNVGEITAEELKEYDGSDPKKPLLMAIKGQIYDVTQSRMFYGPGGPYALFAGKDASRALAKMSFEDKDLNGDLTGLGMFELEALQDWEYKFMSKYVKVGTVKTTVPEAEVFESSSAVNEEAKSREVTATDDSKLPEVSEDAASKPVETSESSDSKTKEVAEIDSSTKLSENGVIKPAEVSESADAISKHIEAAGKDDPKVQQNGVAKAVESSEIVENDAPKHSDS